MRLALVVAMDENGVIGDRGGLPWRISDDLRWFKAVTLSKPVVMGRKTFDSIGKALPGRANIVVTRQADWRAEGAHVVSGLEAALARAADSARADGKDEICVIGGAEIFAQTLALADRIYLTRVAADIPGDAHFPRLEPRDWIERPAGGCDKSRKNERACGFYILERPVRPV